MRCFGLNRDRKRKRGQRMCFAKLRQKCKDIHLCCFDAKIDSKICM
uniref:Uncharacterized protein n=1 Tax=Anguilla anguilla TaxID=7936 RepID=A0A0E9UVQ8_ANGAN